MIVYANSFFLLAIFEGYLVFSLLRAHESRTLYFFVIIAQFSVAERPSMQCMNAKSRQMNAVGVCLKWTGFN